MKNNKEMKKDEKVLIQIKNLHIHMDEHMDSTNIYNPDRACEQCCCDCEEQEIDMDELAMEVCKDVKFPLSLVECVLQSAEKILIEKGFLEDAEDTEDAEATEAADDVVDTEDAVDTDDAKVTSEAEEAECSEEAPTEEELTREEEKLLDRVVEKWMPGIALLAFMKVLSELAEEIGKEDKDHGKSE